MCKHHSSSHTHGFHHGDHHHHEHDHHHGHDHHHHEHAENGHEHEHEATHAEDSALSAKEKLVVRLEHYVHHNNEHADFLEKLVATARELGVEGAAEEIRAAADCAVRQSEHLQTALGLVKSE